MSRKKVVSVIGASDIDEELENIAVEVGKLLAKNNYAVACGGLYGIMEAVCRGAKSEKGLTIGIIPHKEKSAANEFVDIVIPVPFSQARNIVVVLAGEACVAIGGSAGTLSEMCFAWIYGKPLISISTVKGWSSKLANQKIDDRRSDRIYGVETAKEVIDKLREIEKQAKPASFEFSREF